MTYKRLENLKVELETWRLYKHGPVPVATVKFKVTFFSLKMIFLFQFKHLTHVLCTRVVIIAYMSVSITELCITCPGKQVGVYLISKS